MEYPILYHGVRSAACLLALVLSGSILLFGISSDVRAAVLGWFKQLKEGTHFEYDFEGDNAVDMNGVRYEPGWVPEGFELVVQEVDESRGTFIYVDSKGFNADFSYLFALIEGDQNINSGFHDIDSIGSFTVNAYDGATVRFSPGFASYPLHLH